MRLKDPFSVVAVVMALLALSLLAFSMTEDERSGTVKLTVTGPRGVVLGHLGSGRTITGSYNADAPLDVYLLKSYEAEELRNPTYYSDPSLPEPIASGQQGSFRVKVPEGGSYEVIFWNGSFTKNHFVSYDISTGKRILEGPFIASIVSMIVLSGVLFVIAYLRGRRPPERGSVGLRR